MAQTFPAHPSGSASPRITLSATPPACPSASATAAVPSALPSSTSTTASPPGYPCASSLGSVQGNIAASSRAGITATTEGQSPPTPPPSPPPTGSRHPVRQYPPCATNRYTHATAESTHATTRISIPAASHKRAPPPSPAIRS